MTAAILISLFVLLVVLATVVTVRRDGRGPSAPPRSHYEDRRFRSPASFA